MSDNSDFRNVRVVRKIDWEPCDRPYPSAEDEEVNDALALGWKLLGVNPYVIGWEADTEPPLTTHQKMINESSKPKPVTMESWKRGDVVGPLSRA